MRIFLNDALV